jgi:hypothetical protein
MTLEQQDRVVTAQAAHHALQALHCPIHGALGREHVLRPPEILQQELQDMLSSVSASR